MRKIKPKMGRPSKGRDARNVRIVVKATANEVVAWRKAAQKMGMMLGPWLVKPRRDELAKEKD